MNSKELNSNATNKTNQRTILYSKKKNNTKSQVVVWEKFENEIE